MAKILIADDSTVCRTVLSILLTNQGHVVAQAIDGREALAKLEHGTYDLVLLDHDMPFASGTTVLRRLREKSAVPAIVVSGTVSPVMEAEYTQLKAAEIYTKPVDPKRLRDKIQSLLQPRAEQGGRKAFSAFQKELDRVRNFPSTLTLLGGPQTPFGEIISEIVDGAEQVVVDLPENGGAELLERVPQGSVIVIPSASALSVAAQVALKNFVSKPHPRVVLCITSSIEELEDMGFSQTLLMRFGARCVEIPEDAPLPKSA